jgi:hypothetical protein
VGFDPVNEGSSTEVGFDPAAAGSADIAIPTLLRVFLLNQPTP